MLRNKICLFKYVLERNISIKRNADTNVHTHTDTFGCYMQK